jgi:transcriptional regulator with XRE-family HTH domain
MDQTRVGGFLKELRKGKGITQEQFAEALGVSGRTVSRWETGNNMPDISILVDIADFYDVSIPEIINGERKSEIMEEQERKVADSMADYATAEKEKIFKEMRIQSIMGACALVVYMILHETGAYMINDVLGNIAIYCETLVFVSVILMAVYSTNALSKLRNRSRKLLAFESVPKSVRFVLAAVIAFVAAAVVKLVLVNIFGM